MNGKEKKGETGHKVCRETMEKGGKTASQKKGKGVRWPSNVRGNNSKNWAVGRPYPEREKTSTREEKRRAETSRIFMRAGGQTDENEHPLEKRIKDFANHKKKRGGGGEKREIL